MESWRKEKIDQVYSKWEKRVPENGFGRNKNAAAGMRNGRRNHWSHGRYNGRSSYSQSNGRDTRYCYNQHRGSHEPRKTRYKQRMERKERTKTDCVSFSLSHTFVPSLGFDLSSAQNTYAHKSLSLHPCCPKCLPSSRSKFFNKDFLGAGLLDLLVLPRASASGVFGRNFPYITWVLKKPFILPLVDPQKPTMLSTRVEAAIEYSATQVMSGVNIHSPTKPTIIQKAPANHQVAMQQQRRRANAIVSNMSSTIYQWLLRFSNYTMYWVFSKLFNHLYVQRSHVNMLLEAQKKGIPIIFLPSHKSHVDYILITFVLVNSGIKIPHIAAGDNLNIPIFSWLIKHLGGWFIRRRLDSGNGRDDLYRKCLHEYMEQLLKANQNIEFYIEGSRSRTGKPALPKAGLLSVLVETVKEGIVSDVLLVPVSITYDRIVERNFIRHELMGGNKRPENFLKGLKGVWSMLTKSVGCVRMDFAQPFSLQEYIHNVHISNHSQMDFIVPTNSLVSPNPVKSSPDRRLVTALSYHITYDFTCCAAVMSTNIVGFLLLTKYRTGVRLPDLISSYEWMVAKITSCGRAIGFSGPPADSVHHALFYLKHLVVYDKLPLINGIEPGMCEVVRPRLELPDVFELLHHTNQVSHVFIKDAIIACSLAVLCADESYIDEEVTLENTPNEVSQTELTEQALFMTQIFAREFVIAPPCVDISSALYEGIESLIRSEIIKNTQPEYLSYSRLGMKKIPKDSWDDDWDEEEEEEDIMLEISQSREAEAYLLFLRSILGPYIEGYWNCGILLERCLELEKEMKEDFPNEMTFLHQLQDVVTEKGTKGYLYHIESCSSDILRNSLRIFATMEVITTNTDGKLSVVDESKLSDIIDTLSICKM